MIDLTEYYGFPDESILSEANGISENHLYADFRSWRSRESFVQMWSFEEQLLAYPGDLDSEEAALEFLDQSECAATGLDHFVGSAVVALLLAGAVPFSSCGGGPGHFETHPLVAFWCDRASAGPILRAAESAGVCVSGASGDLRGLVVWTERDVLVLRNFAKQLALLAE